MCRSRSSFAATVPRMTRPLVAPRSMAATDFIAAPPLARYPRRGAVGVRTAWRRGHRARLRTSSQEGGGDARVDRDVEARRVAEVGAGQHGHRVRHVLGENLAFQDG